METKNPYFDALNMAQFFLNLEHIYVGLIKEHGTTPECPQQTNENFQATNKISYGLL